VVDERKRAVARRPIVVAVAAAAGLAALFAAGSWLAGLAPNGARPLAERATQDELALGRKVYDERCAACHGKNLEGEPNWRDRKPTGRLPAPPHDDSGHTWHHPDAVLFGITKEGLVPGKNAPPGYQSDMPGFAGALSDAEIWAVLAYIASRWSPRAQAHQAKITREQAAHR
jgi:mono/diheme cytochrome c family protein